MHVRHELFYAGANGRDVLNGACCVALGDLSGDRRNEHRRQEADDRKPDENLGKAETSTAESSALTRLADEHTHSELMPVGGPV